MGVCNENDGGPEKRILDYSKHIFQASGFDDLYVTY